MAMACGRLRAQWQQTSAHMALLANCHRDPQKSREVDPEYFVPKGLRKRQQPQEKLMVGIEVLRHVFCGKPS